MQHTLGAESHLRVNFGLDWASVGSQSRHLLDQLNLNAIPYGAAFLPQNQDPTKNPAATLGSSALNRDFLRPYPGYGDISIHREGSSSNYNSLQLSVNRRFLSRLFFWFPYTPSATPGGSPGGHEVV